MYAVIEVGATQYTVKKDDIIDIERQDAAEGKEISFNKVLLATKAQKVEIGLPFLKEVKVQAQVLKHIKSPKLLCFKYRRRKSKHWKKGHRQELTRVKIKAIEIS